MQRVMVLNVSRLHNRPRRVVVGETVYDTFTISEMERFHGHACHQNTYKHLLLTLARVMWKANLHLHYVYLANYMYLIFLILKQLHPCIGSIWILCL